MQIDVRGKGLSVTAGLRSFVERRVRLALGSRSERIDRVQVWLEDVNGPKGGDDKRCRVRVQGREVGERVVEARGADLGTTVFEAAERIGRATARAWDRLKARREPTLANVEA